MAKPLPPTAELAKLAIAGDIPGLLALVGDEDCDAAVYKWLSAASDFGHAAADDAMDDLLEVSSLRHDDDQFVTGNAHWELGVAYLTASDGLPRDFDKARGELELAHERGYPMSVEEGDAMLKTTRERLTPEARAVLDAVYS